MKKTIWNASLEESMNLVTDKYVKTSMDDVNQHGHKKKMVLRMSYNFMMSQFFSGLADAANEYEKLTIAQQKEFLSIKAEFLGSGGYTISENSGKAVQQQPGTFDYRVSLRAQELDQHGVTSFITDSSNNVNFTVEDYEKILSEKVANG